jgi:hypothetical protein
MVRKNLWVFGLCLLFAGVVGTVGTAALSADVSISDREAGQVWGGQYCPPQYTVVNGCGVKPCPACASYVGGGTIACTGLQTVLCVSGNPNCGTENRLVGCTQ